MNKFLFLILASLMLVVSFVDGSVALAAESSYPLTVEGAKIEILKPVSRGGDGLVKLSTKGYCNVCTGSFSVSVRAQILIASTGMTMSAIELANHIHKSASVQITKSGVIGGFSFDE